METKSREYWLLRQAQWWKNQDRADAEFQKQLEKYYRESSKVIEKEIALYFSMYGKDNVVEFRALLQSLDNDQRRLLFEEMDKFALKYPQYAHLLPVRESVYKLNRLQGLHYSMQVELLKLGAIEQLEFEKHLMKTYGINYQLIMKELGIGSAFLSTSDSIARSIVFSKWIDDKNFSDRIWGNKSRMLNYLKTDFSNSIIRGDNYRDVTNTMRNRFGVSTYDAKRLVYTESSFVLNQSHTRAYVDAGLERYEYNAVLDSDTSKVCTFLNGQKFRFDEAVVGQNFPPMHPFCRSSFIGVFEDEG